MRWKRERIAPKTSAASVRPFAGSCDSSASNAAGAATKPSVANPPIQITRISSDAYRNNINSIVCHAGQVKPSAINSGTVDWPAHGMPAPSLTVLHNLATQLRIDSVRSTTAAGSGHPTTCLSAADIVAALFFAEMRFDPQDPQHPEADRFVLSKGHAAPMLYAAWAAAGAFPREEVLKLRKIDSDLEGHPTPRLPFVDVATGSLGQGLCAAVGMALNARRIGSDYRTYVLLGDGETAEGSVWEAAQVAEHHQLDNLCAITDVNGFGQSRATQWDHALEEFTSALVARSAGTRSRSTATICQAILSALAEATDREVEADDDRREDGERQRRLAHCRKGRLARQSPERRARTPTPPSPSSKQQYQSDLGSRAGDPEAGTPARRTTRCPTSSRRSRAPAYKLGDQVATREAYGTALVALGKRIARVVALDADVKNSTFSEHFEKVFPDRFYQCFIAEQAMVGAAMGLASRGAIPFPSSFACFLERASDFIRMAGISESNVKLAGSHAGVSIGEDGPSQMALEDLAMMRGVPNCTVLYPSDGVSAERLVALAAASRAWSTSG